jgi:hypothetical protein
VTAPRTAEGRATDSRWYNFDPATYLECGLAGTFGGWDDLADFALCGQEYE